MPNAVKAMPWGPLTALAVGDAFGVQYEFVGPLEKPATPSTIKYGRAALWPHMPAGMYSDDAQRAYAIVQWVMQFPHDDTGTSLGRLLCSAYQQSPREYGAYMFYVYQQVAQSSAELESFFTGPKGPASGAVMGASVLGVLPTVDQVRDRARVQAKLTHGGEAIVAAEATALGAFFLRQGVPKREVRRKLADVLDDNSLLSEYKVTPGNDAMDCWLAAWQAIENSSSLLELLHACMERGGDTDSVASIALGSAYACRELANDLPPNLWFDLEDGAYGRSFLRQLELDYLSAHGQFLRI